MRKILFLIICFIIGLSVGKVYLPKISSTKKIEPTKEVRTLTVDLKIDYGENAIEDFDKIDIEETLTALDALQKIANENNFDLVTEETSFGKFIKRIGIIEGDAEHFWAFLINNEMSNIGADSYTVKDGDQIEFKYTKIE